MKIQRRLLNFIKDEKFLYLNVKDFIFQSLSVKCVFWQM